MNIADLRVEYKRSELDESHADADPVAQFSIWWDEATKAQVRESNAMTLATADAAGKPAARTVLLKGFDQSGFVFFTNYESRKGSELAANAHAALLFFWPELERQVRIDGTVSRTTTEESDRILPQPSSGEPHRGVGLAAESADFGQGVVNGACRGNGAASCDRAEPAAVLGRLSRRAECDRVLAGPAVAAARSTALYENEDAGWTRVRLAP